MVALSRATAPSESCVYNIFDSDERARLAESPICRSVIATLRARQEAGQVTTMWDLHRQTGMPIHDTFAVLRSLELSRLIRIEDNPADPFGASLLLLTERQGE